MKITDDMVERAGSAFITAQPSVALRWGFRSVLRTILEAALVDVREPPRFGYVPDVQFLRTQAKLIEAEEKLAKVRAWRRETLESSGIAVPAWSQLDAILDGEEKQP